MDLLKEIEAVNRKAAALALAVERNFWVNALLTCNIPAQLINDINQASIAKDQAKLKSMGIIRNDGNQN